MAFAWTLLVQKRVIVELKSIESISPIHEAIILTYLRLSGFELGLLINFNVSVLKDGVRRFIMPSGLQRQAGARQNVDFNAEYTEDAEKNRREN